MIELINTPIEQIIVWYIVLFIVTISIYNYSRKKKQKALHKFTQAMDDFWYHINKENNQKTKEFTLQYRLKQWERDYRSIRQKIEENIPESSAKKHITKRHKKAEQQQNIYKITRKILILETLWIGRIFIQK